MKRSLCMILSAALLLTGFVFPAAAAPNAAVWNAKKETFYLKNGPEIIRLSSESDGDGTAVRAYFANTAAFRLIGDAYHAAFEDDDRLYAEALGMEADDVDADLEVGVQIAYSFDGSTWVNDWDTDIGEEEDRLYYPRDEFDLDGDGFLEYRNLPNGNVGLNRLFDDRMVFDGRSGIFEPYYCYPGEGMTIRQALELRNKAMLQGRGEFTGKAYLDDDENGWRGYQIDFNKNTLYVKARYRVYNSVEKRVNGEWQACVKTVLCSDWGPVKTFNNKTASETGQNCIPDASALKASAVPTLRALSTRREKHDRDGVTVTETVYRLAVDYPAALKTALSRFYALSGERREALTGEYYEPHVFFEIRVADGGWFVLTEEYYNDGYFTFSDDIYWIRDKMEALGYQPGDPVYLRATLYGSDSHKNERDDATGEYKLLDADTVSIKSGPSNAIELSLTGKYKVRYETNGGSFASGTKQVETFDDDTDITVDLTTADYTPTRKHFVFGGWFTTEDFRKGSEIKTFTTAEKLSRTYYAKWTELPFRSVSYDMGAVTDYVYNGNPERIYTDDGAVAINDVSYEGAKFLGWYTSPTGGAKTESLAYAGMKKDVTLYARWELPVKQIAYAGAGKDYTNSSKNPASFELDPKGGTAVKLYAPEKKGYVFDGWYLDKNLKDGKLAYSETEGCWLLREREDVTLYAKWILGRWDIRYELGIEGVWNGGNPETYTYGAAVKLADPTRTGYTFGGWYADAAFKTKTTGITAADEGEKTFYAKWTAIPYTVEYRLRDERAAAFFKNGNPTTRTVDDGITLAPLTPLNRRYKFLGWFDNVNADGEAVTEIPAGTDRNVTLYAGIFTYSWGDVDMDGAVTAADARAVLRQAVGLARLADDALAWGDVDAPGAKREITAADARLILRMAVSLDSEAGLKLPELPPAF